MIPEVFPPYRNISSRPVSTETASATLSKFLENSESYPHLHPDATVTASGVSFGAHGPMGGVVLHNLRRVAAGLRGEVLESEETPEPENEDEGESQAQDTEDQMSGLEDVGAEEENESGEWQDLSEYEKEDDSDEEDETRQRSSFVKFGGDAPEVQVIGGAEKVGTKRKSKEDKKARKKAKKERREKFKRSEEKKNKEEQEHESKKKKKNKEEKESKKKKKNKEQKKTKEDTETKERKKKKSKKNREE